MVAEVAKLKFCTSELSQVTTLGQSKVCAAFSNQGKVTLWNLTQAVEEICAVEGSDRIFKRPKERPFFSFIGHQSEGYALSWSPLTMGLCFNVHASVPLLGSIQFLFVHCYTVVFVGKYFVSFRNPYDFVKLVK